MKNYKLLVLSLCLVGFSLLGGCSGKKEEVKNSEEKSEAVKTLNFVNFRDIRDLNPHLYGGEMFAQNLLFESLIRIADDGSFEPWLAESYSISDDNSTYVFKLREDVSFTDGEKFNAKAAEANINAILANYKRHSWLESVKLMHKIQENGGKPVEATGKYELTIRLGESYYPFLVELGVTRPFRFISPKSFIDGGTKDGVSSLSGTGRYILEENNIDEYAVFVANENYWGTKPEIKKIVTKVMADSQARTLALNSGEIDLIYGMNMLSAETVDSFQNKSGFKVSMSKPISTRMLMLNTQDEILGDLRVRQALAYATDKVKISEGLFNGIEVPADTLFASNIPYADLGLEPYEFKLEKAKQLLEEAGWKTNAGNKYRVKDGQELEITINYDSNKITDKSIAEFMQAELSKIGVKIVLMGEEKQAYQDRLRTSDFDITFNYTWGTPYDPQSFVGSMRESVHGDYMAQLGLTNKTEIDEHISQALRSIKEKDRQEHYEYVLTTLHEQVVYIPITYSRNIAVYSNKVENVTFNPSKYEIPIEKMNVK